MSWRIVKIGDLGNVITGNTPPKNRLEFYGTEYKFIKPTDMEIGMRFTLSTEEYYSEEGFKTYFRSLIPPLSTCVVTIGSIGKKITLTDDYCFVNQAVNAVIPNPEKFDPLFIFYALKNMLHKVKAADTGASSGRENVSKSNFARLTLSVPTNIKTQQKIAAILSAYDDLIENNLKRIRLLEEAAQHLYREWFVKFRFPGWEEVEFKNDLPSGWKSKTLGEVCDLVMGQSPSSEFYNENGEGLPFHQGVTNYGYRYVSHQMYCTNATRIAEEGDILCSVRAPVGRLNITLDKIIIGRGLSAIKNKYGFQSFQFYQLKNHFIQEDMIGGGTIFASVTKKELENQMFICPPEILLTKFESICRPIDNQIKNLHTQNQNLKNARDLLLPRLMNQTIEV